MVLCTQLPCSHAGAACGSRQARTPVERKRPKSTWAGRRTACQAASSDAGERPVLQLHSGGGALTLDDVRDAYEICSLIPAPNERHQCYSVFGIDADRMTNYYELVLDLEDRLATSREAAQDPDEYAVSTMSWSEM